MNRKITLRAAPKWCGSFAATGEIGLAAAELFTCPNKKANGSAPKPAPPRNNISRRDKYTGDVCAGLKGSIRFTHN
jgi:hypothetical protein